MSKLGFQSIFVTNSFVPGCYKILRKKVLSKIFLFYHKISFYVIQKQNGDCLQGRLKRDSIGSCFLSSRGASPPTRSSGSMFQGAGLHRGQTRHRLQMSEKASVRKLPDDIYACNPVAITGQVATPPTEYILTEQTCT